MLINLVARDHRDTNAAAIIARLNQAAATVPGITLALLPVQDLTIDTSVTAAQYQFSLQASDSATLSEWTPKLAARLAALPALSGVANDLQDAGSSLFVTLDRATAGRYGVTPATIDNALYDAFGQRIVSTIFTQASQYRVILEAEPRLAIGPGRARQHLPPVLDRHQRPGPALGRRHRHGTKGPAADQPYRPIRRRDDLVQRRAGSRAGRGRFGHPFGDRGGGSAG